VPYINQQIVVGHLGADATYFELPPKEGLPRRFIANFRIAATKRNSRKQGDRKDRTTWFDVKLKLTLNGVTFFTDRLKKGAEVFVQGEPLVDERFDDQQKKHVYHYVQAETVEILSLPKVQPQQQSAAAPAEDDEDDVPFGRYSYEGEEQPAPAPAPPSRQAAPPPPPRQAAPPPAPPARPQPPAAPAPQQRQQTPPAHSPRVHELPDDAATRFDTANF